VTRYTFIFRPAQAARLAAQIAAERPRVTLSTADQPEQVAYLARLMAPESIASAPAGSAQPAASGSAPVRADAVGLPPSMAGWGAWIAHDGGNCPIPQVTWADVQLAWGPSRALKHYAGANHVVCSQMAGWDSGSVKAYRLRNAAPTIPPECLAQEVRPGDGPWIALADLPADAVVVKAGQCFQVRWEHNGKCSGLRYDRNDAAEGDMRRFGMSHCTHVRIVAREVA
jgi:hypothetical protein